MEELFAALQHAHERGIVHRDVKPGNLILQNGTGGPAHEAGMGRARAKA